MIAFLVGDIQRGLQMASKKERQEKKRNAQKEKQLQEQKNQVAAEQNIDQTQTQEAWVCPPRREEIEFEDAGQHCMTYYRIYILHKNHKGEIHRFVFGRLQLMLFLGAFLLVLAITCGVLAFKEHYRSGQLVNAQTMISSLQGQLLTEQQHSGELSLQISELNSKVDILSESLTAKTEALSVYQEEERIQHMPTSYPLRGNASYYVPEGMNEAEEADGEEDTEEETETEVVPEEPMVQFVTGTGSSMVATAYGEISSVEMLEDGSYRIVIDHGNGYQTLYSGAGTILVKEGDSVTTGTILLGITEDDTVLSYQIMLNGEYIDPWECMEIHG